MLVTDTVANVAVQENFREYCDSIKRGGRALIITNIGQPEIVMLSIEDYRNMTENISTTSSQKSKKLSAYEAMETMKKSSHFPKDYDCEAIRDEAIIEKYGCFN